MVDSLFDFIEDAIIKTEKTSTWQISQCLFPPEMLPSIAETLDTRKHPSIFVICHFYSTHFRGGAPYQQIVSD